MGIFFLVIRCPTIPNISDGYYICHPSDDMVYGAVCRFGCYAGHKLTGGTSEITCTQEGKWSNSFPKCQSITLYPIEHGHAMHYLL